MFHQDGYKFIVLSWVFAFALRYWNFYAGILAAFLAIFVMYFFRNPKRYLPLDPKTIISPADGIVVGVQTMIPPAHYQLGDQPCTRISIFLNLFDVHVNCMPIEGKVLDILYHKGQFLNASFDKASELNERNAVVLQHPYGRLVVCQIAGLIARRIRCDVVAGQEVAQGERFGIIRFGSRVDVYLDQVVTPLVNVGQRVRMGETVLYKIP